MEDKLIGTVLDDRYLIREIIGTGGMSIVYKALDNTDQRYVAIKVLKEEFVREPKYRRRFLNESRAIAILSSEYIVDVVDVNFEGDVQYIVMEYLDGITLKQYITDKGPLEVDEALHYCKQILRALRHAHERGVVHRDIKPQNIMLIKDGRIKVTDFGIAHISNFETSSMSDLAIGSVHYISPEQAKGKPTDETSDIYSTGIILYEMITGNLPFEADTAVGVALKQVQETAVRPSWYVPKLPKGVEQIITKAMRKSPAMRYQNADEMIEAIDLYIENNDIVFDYPDGPDEPAAMKQQKEKEQKFLNFKKKMMQNKLLTMGVGVAGALVLVLLGLCIMLIVTNSLSSTNVIVPNLVGRLYSDVSEDKSVTDSFQINLVERTSDEPSGTILEQDPKPDRSVRSGSVLTLYVSAIRGNIEVPDLSGMTLAQAKTELVKAGLMYQVQEKVDPESEEGIVLGSEPPAGQKADSNTTVIIYVSTKTSAELVSIPSVVGKSKAEAVNLITEAGFEYSIEESYSGSVSAGIVISQKPSGTDSVARKGSTIEIVVSLGPAPVVEEDPPQQEQDQEQTDPEQSPENPDPEVPGEETDPPDSGEETPDPGTDPDEGETGTGDGDTSTEGGETAQ